MDDLIRRLHKYTKRMKPWVRIGISPFGIWRPGHPESIQGFDAYDKLYADAKKWLQEGWVDYLTPQLYWTIDSPGQSYPKLLNWWSEQNTLQKHLWPGNFASRVGMEGERRWEAQELLNQIQVTRDHPGASGNVLFSMKSLFADYGELGQTLLSGPYHEAALVPEQKDNAGEPPHLTLSTIDGKQVIKVSNDEPVWLWVHWSQVEDHWRYDIVPTQPKLDDAPPSAIAAVSRAGKLSQPIILNNN